MFKISIILSTYNRPDALRVVLNSLSYQDDKNFEIIVADDGSGESTKAEVDSFSGNHSYLHIKHVWQPDTGFRLARIRNLAVLSATGEYIVFLDGDCVVPPNFVSSHRSLAQKGWMVRGHRILAGARFTEDLLKDGLKRPIEFWNFSNLFQLQIQKKINRISPRIVFPLNFWRLMTPKKWRKIKGCNWAMWREDYLSVRGSDESFEGWGSEDCDVAVRLINRGIGIKDGFGKSYVLHLWHKQSSRMSEKKNLAIVEKRFSHKIIYPTKSMIK
jgi:glycosyltransferase involved in cell wall biosynthesis